MNAIRPRWLTERPIAHRGLHDARAGVIENSLAAARLALARDFAIECDVQISADGEAMVFHDDTLDRLTLETGALATRSAQALTRIALRGGGEDRIPTLPQLLAAIDGRVALIIEIKSRFDGDMRLAERAARILAGYDGPAALKSFDPAVMAHLRAHRATLGVARTPLGMVAEAHYDHPEWAFLTPQQKQSLAAFLHYEDTQPDFLSWGVENLPHATPHLLRAALGVPVMTWTVRRPEQRERAALYADQIVFEGWTPA